MSRSRQSLPPLARTLDSQLSLLNKLRSNYLFLVAIERSRAVTEIIFVQIFTESSQDRNHLKAVESFYKKERKKPWCDGKVLWVTFLHNLAEFSRKLLLVKYKMINIDCLSAKQKDSFPGLVETTKLSLASLAAEVPTMLPSKTGRYLLQIPEDARCICCSERLTGGQAQYQTQYPEAACMLVLKVPPGESYRERMLLQEGAVGVFHPSSLQQPLILTCSNKESCLAEGFRLQCERAHSEFSALRHFLVKSQQCEGCLRFSLKTHKCSRCRAVRYCSQLCLNTHWSLHQESCQQRQQAGPGADLGSRKLKGKSKKENLAVWERMLEAWDPVMWTSVRRRRRERPEKSNNKPDTTTTSQESQEEIPPGITVADRIIKLEFCSEGHRFKRSKEGVEEETLLRMFKQGLEMGEDERVIRPGHGLR